MLVRKPNTSVSRFNEESYATQHLERALMMLQQNGWSQDTTMTFNPNPNDGVQNSFPTSSNPQSYQIITIQGSAVIELSTTSGIIIWLPAWLEKVMCWHIPTDNNTQTFGVPQRIDYSIDADKFYERYKVECASLRVQAGTVSVTNAALAGSLTGVEAYNSLASLVGNGSSVFQIYSFENAPGLNSDIECKVTGIQTWNGVAMLFINSPDAAVQRLEDSAVFTNGALKQSETSVKFVNENDIYSLNVEATLDDAQKLNTLFVGQPVTKSLGTYLKDGVRAAVINWAYQTVFEWAATDGVTPLNRNRVNVSLSFDLKDITGTVVKTGILYSEDYCLPTQQGGLDTVLTQRFNRSGAFPDCLNINENALLSPIREVEFFLTLENYDSLPLLVNLEDSGFNINYPIVNGMTPGIIQQPRLICYTGAEIGTKLTITGSIRVEANPDAERSKFVNNIHRNYNEKEAIALKKVLCDPLSYGVRWAMPAQKYEALMENFTGALQIALEEEPEIHFISCLKQAVRMLINHQYEDSRGKQQYIPAIEASMKSVLRKGFGSLKKIGKDVYKTAIHPVLMAELENVKHLPATAAKAMLLNTFGPMAMPTNDTTYKPPVVKYYSPPNNAVTVAPRAASGYIGYHAATKTPSFYGATNRPPRVEEVKIVKKSESKEIPVNKATLFSTINVIDDELADDFRGTVADGFAIVPTSLVKPRHSTPSYLCGNGKVIHNYSLYDGCLDRPRVIPSQNVVLMRITKINPIKGTLTVEYTDKPVGGRSLELAMWMFNAGIHGYTVFTGAVDEGKILPMADSTALVKKTWCHMNKLTTVGNGDFDIRAERVVDLLTNMKRLIVPKISTTHYNASSFYDLSFYDIDEITLLRPFYTTKTNLKYATKFPNEVLLNFGNLDDVIHATNLNVEAKKLDFKNDPVWIDRQDGTVDLFFLPSIKSRHELKKRFLADKWSLPIPAMKEYDLVRSSGQGVPMASTKSYLAPYTELTLDVLNLLDAHGNNGSELVKFIADEAKKLQYTTSSREVRYRIKGKIIKEVERRYQLAENGPGHAQQRNQGTQRGYTRPRGISPLRSLPTEKQEKAVSERKKLKKLKRAIPKIIPKIQANEYINGILDVDSDGVLTTLPAVLLAYNWALKNWRNPNKKIEFKPIDSVFDKQLAKNTAIDLSKWYSENATLQEEQPPTQFEEKV